MSQMSGLVARDPQTELGVSRELLPRHIAIIMDGNGRWAQQRGLARIQGHYSGTQAVRESVITCAQLGIDCLTLYSFSLENWKRPQSEVDGLMTLYETYLDQERDEIVSNNIRCLQIGRREGLPARVLDQLDRTIDASRDNTGLRLCLALNYGSRAEMVDGIRSIARRVKSGELQPDQIDEQLISNSLYTAGLPDPDLMIRTAGEMRLSNFLLWQMSYAELYVTPVLWPDFGRAELYAALRTFAQRERRFGAVSTDPPVKSPQPR